MRVGHVQLPGGGLAHLAPYGRKAYAAFFEDSPALQHFGAAAAAALALPGIGEEGGRAGIGSCELLAEAELKISQPGFNFGANGGRGHEGGGAINS